MSRYARPEPGDKRYCGTAETRRVDGSLIPRGLLAARPAGRVVLRRGPSARWPSQLGEGLAPGPPIFTASRDVVGPLPGGAATSHRGRARRSPVRYGSAFSRRARAPARAVRERAAGLMRPPPGWSSPAGTVPGPLPQGPNRAACSPCTAASPWQATLPLSWCRPVRSPGRSGSSARSLATTCNPAGAPPCLATSNPATSPHGPAECGRTRCPPACIRPVPKYGPGTTRSRTPVIADPAWRAR